MRLNLATFSACMTVSLAAAGCMFITNFDELTKDELADDDTLQPPDDDTLGDDDGPDDLPNPCATGCDDGNPCTTDACTPAGCSFTPISGLVHDGLSDTISAPSIYRIGLSAAGDRFYSTIYGVFDGRNDLQLGGFDANGHEFLSPRSLAQRLPPEQYQISSPGTLVPDTRAGVELNLYVALREVNEGVPVEYGDVARIRYNRDFSLISTQVHYVSDRPTFDAATEGPLAHRIGPVGGQLLQGTGDPFVVWPGRHPGLGHQPGVFIQAGDAWVSTSGVTPNFIAVSDPISGIAALSTLTGAPGAAWLTNSPAGGVGVFSTTLGGPSQTLLQCDTSSDFSGYSLSAGYVNDGLWALTWGKQHRQAGFNVEHTLLACTSSQCFQGNSPCQFNTSGTPDNLSVGARQLLTESFRVATDPNGLYQALAVFATESGTHRAALYVTRHNLTSSGSEEEPPPPETLGQILLAEAAPGGPSPDWPALAVLPPNKIAVAWIQPASNGSDQEAHIRRYRLCSEN